MTASERYVVELDFARRGDFGVGTLDGKIKQAQRSTDSFKKGWADLSKAATPFASAIDGIVAKTGSFAKSAAMFGGAALFAGATYGVVNLNNELEKAQISLGTIFSAQGIANGVPQGISMAKGLIGQMRVDAQKLPGEFEDLMNIFTTGAIPAFRSGASIDQFRQLSGQAMAAGKVAQMDTGQVAREFAQLLEGRSGAHNVFGMKLLGLSGDSAQKFNSESSAKRFEILSKELGKYSGAIDAFGNSFDAQSSTLVDNLKTVGRTATSSLFSHVKESMGEANAWFSKHQDDVNSMALRVGSVLTQGFETGKRALLEWGPRVANFAGVAYDRFTAIWMDASPYVERFGDAVKAALDDPNGTIDKMIHLGEIWLALKGGGMLLGAGQAAVGAAQGIGGMMQGAGMIGGAAAGGAAKLGGASLAGAGAAAAVALAAVAAAGWQAVALENDREAEHTKNMRAKAEAAMREIEAMVTRGYSEELVQQRTNEMHEKFMAMGENMAAEMLDVSVAAAQAAGTLSQLGTGAFFSKSHEDFLASTEPDWMHSPLKTGSQAAAADKDRNPSADAHKSKGGGGGTIQKVEIVVTSNQNPSRIARAIVGHIGKLARNPGMSPDVRNFSDLEPG